jgi:DNA-binding response OmpR family regulator
MSRATRSCPLAVLVVDDYQDTADSLAMILRSEGFDARAAYGADAALAAVADWRPDAVLLDLAMPGTDGFALAERLCRESLRRPLLVAVTGLGTDVDRDHTRAAGFDHHLVKPVDPCALLALLRAHAAEAVVMAGAERRTRAGRRPALGPSEMARAFQTGRWKQVVAATAERCRWRASRAEARLHRCAQRATWLAMVRRFARRMTVGMVAGERGCVSAPCASNGQ